MVLPGIICWSYLWILQYIFPGIGLAASVSGVTRITDRMLYLAAVACTMSMTQPEINAGRTFPDISRIREVSKAVAVAVIQEGVSKGMCPKITQAHIDEGIERLVARKMYYPEYVPLVDRNLNE